MRKFSSLFACSCFVLIASAQPGQLVNSFGDNGLTGLEMPTVTHEFKATAVQTNGKIVCAGYIRGNGEDNLLVCRFLDDGSLDPGFGSAGIFQTDLYEGESYWAVTIQPDGSIVAAGLTITNNDARIVVTRLNPNGTLDASFASSGIKVIDLGTTSDRAWAVAMQTDGKIIVAGTTNTSANNYDLFVLRLNTDGSLDNTFSGDGWVTLDLGTDCSARGVLVQADGKIVVSGWGNATSTFSAVLARYLTNGTLDPTFNGSGVVQFNVTAGNSDDEFFAVALRPDQTLVGIGSSFEPEGDLMLAQFNSNGTIDTGFGINGYRVYPDVNSNFDKAFSGFLQPNGKVVMSGLASLSNGDLQFMVMRANENGSPDMFFGVDGRALYNVGLDDDVALGCARAQNGDVIAAGFTGIGGTYNGILLRFNGEDVVGIDEHFVPGSLSAFPVPFKDRLTIQFEWNENTTPTPVVFDATGKKIPVTVVRSSNLGTNTRTLQLDLPENLVPGLYSIQVLGGPAKIGSVVLKE